MPFLLFPKVGFSSKGLWISLLVYLAGMFFVTGAYHRYFSHRSYKTSRLFQFVLAFGAQMTCQKGALWWAANHRHHHRYSDLPEDTHSAKLHGFWWSHMGWFLSNEFRTTDLKTIGDLAKFPELKALNHPALMFAPALLFTAIVYAAFGSWGLLYACFLPLVFVFHSTFTINSLAHLVGKRRYDTNDDSKNHWLLAITTMGEGWHNNHHHYQRSCRQGFYWYEIDLTYYMLWMLSKVGLVWDLNSPPRHVVEDRPNDRALSLKRGRNLH